ncbi:MAG: hypothetical protein ABSD29_17820 [Verrucomicrobiota bacterium]|jgi:hypothetical protein
MFTRRPSDQGWTKYLLTTGLVTVDQLERMRANKDQVDIGELLVGNLPHFNGYIHDPKTRSDSFGTDISRKKPSANSSQNGHASLAALVSR